MGGPRRVLLLGATGTIGRATAAQILAAGHHLTCVARRVPDDGTALPGTVRVCDVTSKSSMAADGFCGDPFDVVISCLASRTGAASDVEAIDFQAHVNALNLAQAADAQHFILLSAICVQKPELAFQRAKLRFEQALMASGMRYSIVRATAFFKSLSGQIERVKAGKPFLVFGSGTQTACKPICDEDLAAYLVGCIDGAARHNRVLPIGGPGPAITPLDQARALAELCDVPLRTRRIPLALVRSISGALSGLARIVPPLANTAELARIAAYYAQESMLVWDEKAGRYDAAATPEFGTTTLFDHYAAVLAGDGAHERVTTKMF